MGQRFGEFRLHPQKRGFIQSHFVCTFECDTGHGFYPHLTGLGEAGPQSGCPGTGAFGFGSGNGCIVWPRVIPMASVSHVAQKFDAVCFVRLLLCPSCSCVKRMVLVDFLFIDPGRTWSGQFFNLQSSDTSNSRARTIQRTGHGCVLFGMELGVFERFYLELHGFIDRTQYCTDTQCTDCFALRWVVHVKKRCTQKLNSRAQGGLDVIKAPCSASNVQPLFLMNDFKRWNKVLRLNL